MRHSLKTTTLALALFFLFSTSASAQSSEEAYRQTLIALIASLEEQITLLQAELDAQLKAEVRRTDKASIGNSEERFSGSLEVIARYEVKDGEVTENIPYLDYRRYWDRVQEIFPAEYEEQIAELIFFNGEDEYFDAFVETMPPGYQTWAYAINDEVTDDVETAYNTELIVHELAHLIGYEEVSGTQRPAEVDCEEYFIASGCPLDNSYLGMFADYFWSERELNRALSYLELDDPIEAAEEYFDENEEEYVTSYAATSPEEDFAESFMYFVLESTPQRGEAREKVEFFADFDDMRSIRSDIRRVR